MRKYLLNAGVIGAVLGARNIVDVTRKGPRDWRLVLLWVGWAVSVALAVGTVMQQNDERKREVEEA